jgi:hypothetical protein
VKMRKVFGRSGGRLAVMTVLATCLAIPAFAMCTSAADWCPDGHLYMSGVFCCGSNEMPYGVCSCTSWNINTGYSECSEMPLCIPE